MNYGLIAICDKDSEYANSLADYFRLKGCLSSEIVVFTKPDSFEDYAKEHSFDILIINQEFATSTKAALQHNVFTLCEQRNVPDADTGICLFKYTSAEDILRDVMAGYKPLLPGVAIPFCDKHKGKIVGVYSPVNRCGKTSFALALAMHYSHSHSCIFLSFDSYSSLECLTSDNCSQVKTIDDLLYYFAQSPEIFESKLLSIVKKLQHLDFVPPSEQSCTIGEMTASEQIFFLQGLVDTGRYDYVFLDMGAISPVHPLLQLCQKVFLPCIKDDCYSESKINKLMASLKNITSDTKISDQIILENIYEKVSPPVTPFSSHGSEYIYSLTSGEMANYIASLDKI